MMSIYSGVFCLFFCSDDQVGRECGISKPTINGLLLIFSRFLCVKCPGVWCIYVYDSNVFLFSCLLIKMSCPLLPLLVSCGLMFVMQMKSLWMPHLASLLPCPIRLECLVHPFALRWCIS